MIEWKRHSNKKQCFIAEAGDLHIILKKQHSCWQLLFGIRVYTQDRKQSMVRPPVAITTFEKNCSTEEAQNLTYEHIREFVSGISKDLT